MGRTFYRRRAKKGNSDNSKRRRYRNFSEAGYHADIMDSTRQKLKLKAEHFLSIGNNSAAEKKLLKMLRRNPVDIYALSKLIAIYTSQKRYGEAEKLYEPVKSRISNIAVLNSALLFYIKQDKTGKAREVFEITVEAKCEDAFTYSLMLGHYMKLKLFDEVKFIFERACESNFMCACQTYFDVLDFFFKKGKYDEMLTLLTLVPDMVGENKRTILFGFEAERKLRKYDEVIEKIDEFITGYSEEMFDDDSYIHARTIRAYCMMHCGKELDVPGEFALLKQKVSSDNVHYPRILCGFVFSKPVLTDAEREHILAELDFFKDIVGSSMHGKVLTAMEKLDDVG